MKAPWIGSWSVPEADLGSFQAVHGNLGMRTGKRSGGSAGRLVESIDLRLSVVGGGSAGYSLSVTRGKRKRGFGSMMHSKSEAEYIQKLLLTTIDADKLAAVHG